MAVQIDGTTQTITLSVRDLCDAEATGGSLNLSPLGSVRSDMGRSVHLDRQARQSKERVSYRGEQNIRFTTRFRQYTVVIHGRIDGIYEADGVTIIEEVKSVLTLREDLRPEHLPLSYVWQLRLYLYLWAQLHPGSPAFGQLVLVSCEPEKIIEVKVELDAAQVEALIETRLRIIVEEYQEACRRQALKQQRAPSIQFPFPRMRKHQDQMIEAIEAALESQQNLLISAPTGIGKTVAALYSTLRFAAENQLSIFFLTSKTTQQRIVADTLRLWGQESQPSEGNPPLPLFNSLILRSKEKICANDVVFCHESRCRYAKDFFRKLGDSNVRDTLMRELLLTPELVYAKALEEELCPFELSLELMGQVDLTVCDYNYVYDPRIAIQRLTERDHSRTILIVDEAHNLYSRAREYYSPALEMAPIQRLRRSLESILDGESSTEQTLAPERFASTGTTGLSLSFLGRLEGFIKRLERHFCEIAESYPELQESNHAVISLDREFFESLREELDELMKCYLIYQRRGGHLQDEDRLLDFFYSLSDFCRVLEIEGDEFVHVMDKERHLRIICLDPARQLRKRNQRFYAVIGMSATLSPMEFYRDVLGFERDTRLLALPSPFPPENRKILVIPEVSTTYDQRSRNFDKIARIIEEVVAIRSGNYFAFFPSFEFLKEVAALLSPKTAEILIQHRFMPDHQRSALLERLSEPGRAHLVLAVQGGVFAEGVDYPGELAVGAIIVGPGLPKVSFELELMRQYYEENYGKGFEYAYLYPGMNRVVQSAGRIVRSESDRGVILLLDKRFAYENYSRLFPRDWYESSPAELAVRDFRAALASFWRTSSTA